MSKNIVVFAAHPDDEVLGCSGTLSRHVDDGDSVSIIFMADGETSRNVVDLSNRRSLAYRSCEIIGCNKPEFIDYPDNRMDTIEFLDIVKKIEYFVNKYKPSIVYTHYQNDLNIDHKITYKATMTACRPQPNFCVKEIYSFEVLSSTEWSLSPVSAFNPKKFVDISATLDRKLNAIDEYSDEMRDFPHARSKDAVLYLAKLRGSSIGVEAAEAFQVERLLT